jgi:hypothetical protein
MSASPFRPQVAGEYPDPPERRAASAPLRLYEYADDLLAVRAMLLDSEDGELTPEMEAKLDAAVGNFDVKVEQVAFVIRELTAEAKAIDEEAARIAKRAKVRTNAVARLKSYLQGQLERADVRKVERPLVTVRLQANPPSVRHVLTSEQLAGQEYAPFVRVVPERYELDAKNVVTAWKAGEPLPEGVTVEMHSHLRIA